MTSAGPGRPRKQQPVRPGATARDEILDAAAELFTGQGFANTSTRAIADAVGMRQSSLYHHFGTKDDILGELLKGTVAGGLDFARAVCAAPRPAGAVAAAAALHSVALYDGGLLCSARWNLGILYHLPEARAERFEPFMADRRELRQRYQDLGQKVEELLPAAGGPGSAPLGELAFRLVESLINLRADGLADSASPSQTADAAVVLAGLSAELPGIRELSRELIAQHGR
ncbi:transcriptional regulator, TetR family [Arthrobacter sp. FB24]|uniref:TetR/AcrR family transcriptional regulator n=2 Tax=Arthrobacter TaxID=1663 RepID=UPI0000527A6E|nr:TetR/AcrR family transcriptional regulator [Arthrobacter sp. FB24]ABK05040.1 transcriptional regulator, TetR family [Arthrobacter sp. FB24]